LARLRKKKLHMDSVEAYACMCVWSACVCTCYCTCGCYGCTGQVNEAVDLYNDGYYDSYYDRLRGTEVSSMQYA